jgi:hypothetical protein
MHLIGFAIKVDNVCPCREVLNIIHQYVKQFTTNINIFRDTKVLYSVYHMLLIPN